MNTHAINPGPAAAKYALERLHENFGRWRVPGGLLDELVDQQASVKYPRGAAIFVEGSLGDLFGCVLSGYVKVYCNENEGTRVLVRVAGPGEIIGYPDYEDSRGRRAKIFEVQALTSCSITLFTRDHVARLLRSAGTDRLIELFQSLNTFWSVTLHWWVTMVGLSFQQRLEVVLADLAARLGRRDNRGTLIIPELSHAELAEMIASSRPLVSRLLNQMERRGLIERHGRQYLLVGGWETDGSGYAHVPGQIGEELRAHRAAVPGLKQQTVIQMPQEHTAAGRALRSLGRN